MNDATMTHGKYKGKPITDMDSGYLAWLLTTGLKPDLRAQLEALARERGLPLEPAQPPPVSRPSAPAPWASITRTGVLRCLEQIENDVRTLRERIESDG